MPPRTRKTDEAAAPAAPVEAVEAAVEPTPVEAVEVPVADAASDAERIEAKTKAAAVLELGTPAERRADRAAALEQELDFCQRDGKTERVKAIKAELQNVKSRHAGEGVEA